MSQTTSTTDPAAPYHPMKVPQGGLAPPASPAGAEGGGAPQGDSSLGSVPEPDTSGSGESAGKKVEQERGDHENEAGNVPREEPGTGSAGHP